MDFWEDLDANVKRYIIFAVVIAAAMLAFRACGGSEAGGEAPPRGIAR